MIIEYNETHEKAWDRFVFQESMNGTFLQSRSFLNYHGPNKFSDCSLLFMKGNNIVAVIPANVIEGNEGKIFMSHMGSTFGGIVLGKQYKKISDVEEIFNELEEYLEENHFNKIVLKMTSHLYVREDSELLDYYLFYKGYETSAEIGYYIDYSKYDISTIENNFNASRRRGWKKSIKNNLCFRELLSDKEIEEFYGVLSNNMDKFKTKPIHTLEEIYKLKNESIKDVVRFFGVYENDNMIAGSMVFCFNKQVFHTQYLATDQEKLSLYPSEFLYYELIKKAAEEGFDSLSFGTSTLEHGRVLNKSLAQFKEGFGTKEYVNRTYIKYIV